MTRPFLPWRSPIPTVPERLLVSYHFEGGASVRVIVTGEVETELVMWALDQMLAEKRKELARVTPTHDG